MTLQTLARKLKAFEEPLNHPLLKWLYLHLPPRPITNKKGHRTYAAAVSVLMQEREAGSLHPRDQKVIAKYLSAVVPFIEEYEKDEYSIPSATPEEVLRFLMEQNNLSQYDLAKDLGGQPVVSDILNGKRKLTRDHIERLAKKFHVTPAAFYSIGQNLKRKSNPTKGLMSLAGSVHDDPKVATHHDFSKDPKSLN